MHHVPGLNQKGVLIVDGYCSDEYNQNGNRPVPSFGFSAESTSLLDSHGNHVRTLREIPRPVRAPVGFQLIYPMIQEALGTLICLYTRMVFFENQDEDSPHEQATVCLEGEPSFKVQHTTRGRLSKPKGFADTPPRVLLQELHDAFSC